MIDRATQPPSRSASESGGYDAAAANAPNDEAVQFELTILTSSSKHFRLLAVEIFRGPQESVHPMTLQTRRQVHHAEVVERAIFATDNSLKSHMRRNLKSPFSNNHAVTSKLCTPSRPTPVDIDLILKPCAPFNFP